MYKIEPVSDYVFIESLKEKQTSTGIIIPEGAGAAAKAGTGKVFAVGPDVSVVKVGDMVIYSKYAGEDLAIRESLSDEEQKYQIIHQDSISAIISHLPDAHPATEKAKS